MFREEYYTYCRYIIPHAAEKFSKTPKCMDQFKFDHDKRQFILILYWQSARHATFHILKRAKNDMQLKFSIDTFCVFNISTVSKHVWYSYYYKILSNLLNIYLVCLPTSNNFMLIVKYQRYFVNFKTFRMISHQLNFISVFGSHEI